MGLTVATGAAVTLACLAWAVQPLPETGTPVVAIDPAPAAAADDATAPPAQAPLLAARLWNPPPPPAEPDKPVSEAPQRPPPYQLIGIIQEDGEFKAALYDPAADRILIVRSGDGIEGHTVVSVDQRSVEISDGTGSSTIVLEEEQS